MLKLNIENIRVKYAERVVLNGISAQFRGGEMTSVIGKNGIGKTTLIKAIAKLIKHSGTVSLTDDKGSVYSASDMAYLPQMSTSDSKLTVFEMVLLGLVKHLRWRVSEEQIEQAAGVLKQLNLLHLSNQPFHQLSGGQKQLVSMARSLVSGPKVLLLDEPASALDIRHQLMVMDLARKYTKQTGAVTIFVEHDLTLAARYSDRMLLLDDAEITAFDTPEQVLRPDVLEKVYRVKVKVEKTSLGSLNVIPIEPL